MAIKIEKNIPLKNYSTMRVGGPAKFLTHVLVKEDIREAVKFAKDNNLKVLAIGRGANILFTDDGFDGLVVVIDIKSFEIIENGDATIIRVGAGENWDETVKRTVDSGLSGMEAMSMIPGNVGAAPIMNIGAYGQDVSNIISSITAYDLKDDSFLTITNEDCGFGYRGSRFINEDKGRFIIADVTFKLHHNWMKPPFYKDMGKYFEDNNVSEFSPSAVREAVIDIRTRKLPDPVKVGTNGSFFKNPVVSKEKWEELVSASPELDTSEPQWPQKPRWFQDDGSVKVAAARLIELTGLHELEENGVSLWPTQHLTIVNRNAKSASNVLTFKDKIKDAVNEKFGILLEEEVQIIG